MPFTDAWHRFRIAISVLQTPDALFRMAHEAVEDLAADEVIYAELRFAPLGHLAGGLAADEVMEAVTAGIAAGEAATGCIARTIVCGIRENPTEESSEAARLAAAWAGRGVVGFDLAGNEYDFGPELHVGAFRIVADAGLGITVHAGEMAGPESVAKAIQAAAPHRIGHGMHLIDDCTIEDGGISTLGPTARLVLDTGLPLEVSVTSNACLGVPVPQHPVRMLFDAGFKVSVNPDDRTITTTTAAREYELWRTHHGFTDVEFRLINLTAAEAAFCDESTRGDIRERIAAGWI